MITSIIAAIAANGVIGNKDMIPWNSKEDMKFFKEKTYNHPVIMGRKTYDSLRIKPLPKRFNLVVTRNKDLLDLPEAENNEGPVYVDSLATALDIVNDQTNECFIIGGAELYKDAIDNELVDRMYLNYMNNAYEGTIHFPYFDKKFWVDETSIQPYTDFKAHTFIRKPEPE